jgi:hypothetical protein
MIDVRRGILDAAEANAQMEERLLGFITDAKVTNEDLVDILNLTRTAVTNKLARRRKWQIHEVEKVLDLCSLRLRRRITFDDALGRRVRRRRS